jgi:hypothetical protein
MFFFYQIHFLRSILRRPNTDRIPEGVPKKFRRNRNCDSCEKSATGTEITGIRRIPADYQPSLVWAPTINDVCRFGHYFRWRTSDLLKTLAVVQLN